MDGKTRDTIGGLIFVGLLTAVFAGLRLAGITEWPWFWVLSPLWVLAIMYFAKAMGMEIPTAAQLVRDLRAKIGKS